tara:strand:- start:224 stop:943 length:720 start_codon:yes stop_codon:yes gene_type:complete
MSLKEILKKLIPISLLEYYWNYKRKNKTYYGRNKIDKIILKYLNFNNGFFVELGANDGIKESNTFYFEKNLNWTGILIEPSIENYEKCKKNRSKENFFFNNACVSFDYKKQYVDLFFSDLMTIPLDLETDNPVEPSEHAKIGEQYLNKSQTIKKIKSEASTLNNILNLSKSPKLIDFLSLDVEGAEIEVLKGIDHNEYRFKYILVESRNKKKIVNFMKNVKYELILELENMDFLFKNIS